MPEILHRISIDAPPERVHRLVATADGVARWWTGRPVSGGTEAGERFRVFFGDADDPAAEFEVIAQRPDETVWRVGDGPAPWVDTVITFSLQPAGSGTTLLFRHSGWREADEFMSGCSTNWGAYLTSLKHGAEGGAFGAYPAGEISRWD
jgi:uncharacterized protein YndB with AHSA1/START domain